LWARAANGFKLPSFFSLGNPLFGNPALDLEKVRNFEVGAERSFGNVHASVSVFSNLYTNLVDFDFETFTNINRGRINVDGAAVGLDYSPTSDLALGADLTWSDVSSSGEPLRRRPETTGGAHMRWTVSDGWTFDAAVRYVGSCLITSIPTGDVHEGPYMLVDATLNRQVSKSLVLWLALDNATDTDHQGAPGFPSPGRRVRLGFMVTL
jgi:outer membrane cobalamin receptor